MNQIKSKDENIKDKDASWLLRIPDELKLKVFENLSSKDLISVSETCSQLNGLIQDPSLWTELTVDLSESRRSLIWKVTRCPLLNTLKITNRTRIHYSDTRNLNKLTSLSRRTPHLKKIQLIGFMMDEDDSDSARYLTSLFKSNMLGIFIEHGIITGIFMD